MCSLVRLYPNTDTVNKAEQTLLSVASAGGHLTAVKYLVEVHHCDPRGELTSDSFLCYTMQSGVYTWPIGYQLNFSSSNNVYSFCYSWNRKHSMTISNGLQTHGRGKNVLYPF